MLAKRIVCFFIVLLLLSGLMCSVDAVSDTTVSFRGGGVTIDLTYPEEAHSNETITHNVTITAHKDLSLQYFALFIYAPVNATWQEVKNRTMSWDFLENETLTSRIEFQLPQDVNGTLYCEMTVKTDQIVDVLSYKFYTTRFSELTFSEMQSLYYEMLANYTSLQTDYETLLEEYDGLLANYSSLLANYMALLSAQNQLTADYNSKIAAYASMLAQYNKLSDDYDALNVNYRSKIGELGDLQTNYENLNSTRNNLQTNLNTLQAIYDGLNQTYVDLQTEFATLQQQANDSVSELTIDRIVMFIFIVAVAGLIVFIVYLKRKKEEPYVVIRKETVSMK